MLYGKMRDIKTPFTRNLYHRSTLQIIRQSSGGLVLPKSGIKPFLTGGLNETTIFRPRLLDYLPDPQEKKGKAFGRKLTRNHFFCAYRFCYCTLVFFQTAKHTNLQGHYCYYYLFSFYREEYSWWWFG